MIVVDIETSGIDFLKNGIWQIGAVDSDDAERIFIDECRIDDDDEVTQDALNLVGMTEEKIRSKHKQSQKELLERFFEWCNGASVKNFICHNPQFDYAFIKCKAEKYGLRLPVSFLCVDTHSIAILKYFDIYEKLPVENNRSCMSLKNIIFFCGMEDMRDKHNALEDAKLTAECFHRMVYGKSFLKEFEQYPLPKYLLKE